MGGYHPSIRVCISLVILSAAKDLKTTKDSSSATPPQNDSYDNVYFNTIFIQ